MKKKRGNSVRLRYIVGIKSRHPVFGKPDPKAVGGSTAEKVMSVKITPEIRQALRHLIDEWGSSLEVERRTHIANSTISRYLSGKLSRMNTTTWNMLAPHLTPFLPQTENSAENLPTLPPSNDIFRKILYDDGISDAERVKFLRLLVMPKTG